MRSSKKGQMALLAVAAFVMIIAVVLYYSSRSTTVSTDTETKLITDKEIKEIMTKMQQSGQNFLTEALYEGSFEMGQHGGYNAENSPSPNYGGIPYWFTEGTRVNIPTANVMKQMLEDEIERRVEDKMNQLRQTLEREELSIGFPEVKIEMDENQIKAEMDLPINFDIGETASTNTLKFNGLINSRLLLLRNLAETYIHKDKFSKAYEIERSVEQSILESLESDSRIASINGIGSGYKSCDAEEVYKTKSEMWEPFRENANLAVAMELQRIRQIMHSDEFLKDHSDIAKESIKKHIDWSVLLNVNSVQFSFIANEGTPHESTEEVKKVNAIDVGAGEGVCDSTFSIKYDVHFPVRIVITDMLETAKVVGVGGRGESEIRPLQFKFVVGAFIEDNQYNAVNTTFANSVKKEIDSLCEGSCKLDITLKGSSKGILQIDSCKFKVHGGKILNDPEFNTDPEKAPCGIHTFTYEPSEPERAKFSERVNIGKIYSKTIEIRKWAELHGTTKMIDRVLCSGTKTTKEKGKKPLIFIEGKPPRMIKIFLKPVSAQLGETISTYADEKGEFHIEKINPGKYLLLAFPSEDVLNTPTYKVQPYGVVIDIEEKIENYEILMEPVFVEKDSKLKEYVYISGKEDC